MGPLNNKVCEHVLIHLLNVHKKDMEHIPLRTDSDLSVSTSRAPAKFENSLKQKPNKKCW